jgi:hypothetical protein
MKSPGNVSVPAAREIVTLPSSNAGRITYKIERRNSGNSSKNKIPMCAKLTSPGARLLFPPSNPAMPTE